ncbi:unnamed protein product [Phytophthora fragariaefolia]|uniref:Unnamed protein product n=1 Tax=Phytophthora fragariaefolia TaxID=1490495 RepID=A0A9W7CRG8_9STRA|nr:unnamed protein product [Phytophthora fragariaefolia]
MPPLGDDSPVSSEWGPVLGGCGHQRNSARVPHGAAALHTGVRSVIPASAGVRRPQGVMLTTQAASVELHVAGYADATAVYLPSLFSEEVPGYFRWVTEDIAGLPRHEGGMAVPNLKAERLAMAAATISTWANEGTMLVGDILHVGGGVPLAPPVFVTPNYGAHVFGGFRQGQNLWTVGVDTVRAAGEREPSSELQATVRRLYHTAQREIPTDIAWGGDQCVLDLSFMDSAQVRALQAERRWEIGQPSLEWLPTFEIRVLLSRQEGHHQGLLHLAQALSAKGRLCPRSGELGVRQPRAIHFMEAPRCDRGSSAHVDDSPPGPIPGIGTHSSRPC